MFCFPASTDPPPSSPVGKSGFSGSSCATEDKPTSNSGGKSDLHHVLRVSKQSVGAWHHWKLTVSGADSGSKKTLKLLLDRGAATSGDAMLFLRKGTKATKTGSASFSYSFFDQDSWKTDKRYQTIEIAPPTLVNAVYYISVFNWDRYVKASATYSLTVDIATPSHADGPSGAKPFRVPLFAARTLKFVMPRVITGSLYRCGKRT